MTGWRAEVEAIYLFILTKWNENVNIEKEWEPIEWDVKVDKKIRKKTKR